MKKVLEGSHAVAEAVRLAKVQVISAYPITPQTHIVEILSDYVTTGKMNAKYLRVESEHSCMAALIGAQSAGIRTFTATSSQGLALMHELLHWTSGARLPIVMAEVNRALAPGWNIWNDQTDSLAQRDTGWMQLYCEDGQEVLDTTIQAYRLAEKVNLPAMVVLDAFYLSHTYEPVDVPEQDDVDRFLPPYEPAFILDTKHPYSLSPLVTPNAYMEMRYDIAAAMDDALEQFDRVEDEFAKIFDRRYGAVEAIDCEGADIIFVTSGTVTSTGRLLLEELRPRGEKVGVLKIKLFRPFPVEAVRRALGKAKKVAVIDRNFSFGASGIFAQEVRAAICNSPGHPPIFGYIAGLGGRDITVQLLEEIYFDVKGSDTPRKESIWVGLQEVNRAT
ncbi:MAG: pyruvate ferredoxin oxidoreductase [Syntrophales bacterium]|jgi:pyruvate ferredoxin oxidoreductase alpha subunit|nr:pyruvate ferredoxin oxidoreductase [Syntrophales bacterium]